MSETEKMDYWTWPVEDGCHLWVGYINDQGYGQIYLRNRLHRAHRAAWEIAGHPLGSEEILDHACGKRSCVNPNHLRVSDRKLNGQYRTVPNRNNRTGYRGVILDDRYGTYSAEVMAAGRRYRKAGFHTAEEAHEYAKSVRARVHPLGEFNLTVV